MAQDDNKAANDTKADKKPIDVQSQPQLSGSGLSTGLQPSGTKPGGGPGTSAGSIGSGGGSTGGTGTGNAA